MKSSTCERRHLSTAIRHRHLLAASFGGGAIVFFKCLFLSWRPWTHLALKTQCSNHQEKWVNCTYNLLLSLKHFLHICIYLYLFYAKCLQSFYVVKAVVFNRLCYGCCVWNKICIKEKKVFNLSPAKTTQYNYKVGYGAIRGRKIRNSH